MIYYNEGKNLVKIWDDNVEDSAMGQIKNLSQLPFVYKHIAIMADNHAGFGCPIGTVLATKNVVVPNLTGVDIGCGMCAVRTSLTEIDTETLKKIMSEIRKVIPVGLGHQRKKQDESLMPNINYPKETPIVDREYENALTQIGTLGGGNHFCEIQKGSDGFIWIMIHSGSRNLGYKVADYYNKLAKKLNEKWFSEVPKEWDLAFLPIDSEEGQAYLREMNYAVGFALANRKLMMERIKDILIDFSKKRLIDLTPTQFDNEVNIAHNYVVQENHFGQNVWVHRKGATLAREGTIGIIPGSMGSASYIVKGRGNKDSFESCSHGAGRRMGRKEAIRTLNLEEEQKKMEGIIGAPRNKNDLEEAPGAYKNIDSVMANQIDLVSILVELKPLCVIKG
jgi:tRNA-splicing ligase RtcB